MIVESASSGKSLLQVVRQTHDWIYGLGADKGKVPRAHEQSVKIEQGMVYLPEEVPWLATLENELKAFPNGKFDDQVDALTQFLRALDWKNHHLMNSLSMNKG